MYPQLLGTVNNNFHMIKKNKNYYNVNLRPEHLNDKPGL